MYSDGSGHSAILTLLAIVAGVLVSGVITGLGSAMGREDDESFWGAFTGGFIDGAVGSLAVALTAALPGVGGILAGAGLAFVGGFVGNAVGQGISYGFDNIDFRASALQGGISALVNGFTGVALRISGVVSGATKFAKFINASKISALGVAITGYFTYYSFPSANKIRRRKELDTVYEI